MEGLNLPSRICYIANLASLEVCDLILSGAVATVILSASEAVLGIWEGTSPIFLRLVADCILDVSLAASVSNLVIVEVEFWQALEMVKVPPLVLHAAVGDPL
jgi:hypothetical protein